MGGEGATNSELHTIAEGGASPLPDPAREEGAQSYKHSFVASRLLNSSAMDARLLTTAPISCPRLRSFHVACRIGRMGRAHQGEEDGELLRGLQLLSDRLSGGAHADPNCKDLCPPGALLDAIERSAQEGKWGEDRVAERGSQCAARTEDVDTE